jgi:hypothetical protein
MCSERRRHDFGRLLRIVVLILRAQIGHPGSRLQAFLETLGALVLRHGAGWVRYNQHGSLAANRLDHRCCGGFSSVDIRSDDLARDEGRIGDDRVDRYFLRPALGHLFQRLCHAIRVGRRDDRDRGLSRSHCVHHWRLRLSGEMVRRKEIDVQSKLLRRVQRAAGERVVEWTAFDAEYQGYRRVGGLSGLRGKRRSERAGRQHVGARLREKNVHKLLLIRLWRPILEDRINRFTT